MDIFLGAESVQSGENSEFGAMGQQSVQRSIRQIKKHLFEEVKEMRELRISDIAGLISPASALITFLHLANEKDLVVRNGEYEEDVILSWD